MHLLYYLYVYIADMNAHRIDIHAESTPVHMSHLCCEGPQRLRLARARDRITLNAKLAVVHFGPI